jgi:hypothetical protein
VIVQLTPADEVEHCRQGGDRTVAAPGNCHGHDIRRDFFDTVQLKMASSILPLAW